MNTMIPCVILPLMSGTRIPPHAPTKVLGRPPNGRASHPPLTLARLNVSGAGTPGGARDWIINDIEVDGVSQLTEKDLSGALFSSRGIAAGDKHAASEIRFTGLHVIESDSEVAITITYVGPNPEGVPFYGTIVGEAPPQRPTVLPIVTRHPILSTTNKKLDDWHSVKTTIRMSLDETLKVERLEIESGGSGVDWIVNDIRIDGVTRFVQSGDIPGDLFWTRAIDSFVNWRKPGKQIDLDVTYIGLEDKGIPFIGRVFGTVVRDNHDQPPPDVRVIVRASNDDSDEIVTARCNWRAPYVPENDPASKDEETGSKPGIVIIRKDKES